MNYPSDFNHRWQMESHPILYSHLNPCITKHKGLFWLATPFHFIGSEGVNYHFNHCQTQRPILLLFVRVFFINLDVMNFFFFAGGELIYLDAYTGWPTKNGTVDAVDFAGLCSDHQLYFFTLLDRPSFPHYNNTKIIKFGWELFISWVISYGLSFLGFARFPEFWGTTNDKLMANPENDSP